VTAQPLAPVIPSSAVPAAWRRSRSATGRPLPLACPVRSVPEGVAACRLGGALALRPQDLDRQQCLVLLREKGETVRWQPVSPTLMAGLLRHAEERHAPAGERLLRYRTGKEITRRRYDGLWERIGRHLPWTRTQQISTHWLRHTTLTWVERNFGFAVAHAYAGHTDGAASAGSATSTYVRATLTEVATALAALTGEPHPLAQPEEGHHDIAG
jgi:integrase/recombinase XerC